MLPHGHPQVCLLLSLYTKWTLSTYTCQHDLVTSSRTRVTRPGGESGPLPSAL